MSKNVILNYLRGKVKVKTNASLSSGCSGRETSKCTTDNPKRRYVFSFTIKKKTFGGCFGSNY